MVQNDSFARLMIRMNKGDGAPATEVFGRFIHRLIALASDQLGSWRRRRADLEGVVQSAHGSSFDGRDSGQGREQGRRFGLEDRDSLWGLLAVIALRKCDRRRDSPGADRGVAGREVSLRPGDGSGEPCSWEAIGRDPTPLEAATLTETVDQLLEKLERPEREIIELGLQGHTAPEIAARLGRSRRTVRRVRERVKDELLHRRHEETQRPVNRGQCEGTVA
jgi:RNA polymerase sigma-70 factor (ECF subfamily)